MMFVALKMLVGDRLKYIALVAGVAFAALLITQQASIFMGFALRIGSWIRETSQADLWVMDPQVRFSEDIKPLSDTALQRVRGVDGVAWAVPMYKGFLRVRLPDGSLLQARVIGLDDATLTGGPPGMHAGQLADLREDRAILVNHKDLTDKLALQRPVNGRPAIGVGDHVSINDNDARIVGTYAMGEEFFWEPLIYTTYSRALAWAPRERKLLTYVLVKVQPGRDPREVAERIERATGYKASTNAEFEADSMNYLLAKTGILANFGITIGLGFVIGLLVSGQTFYTFVLDNLRHFAALKAMGTSTPTLFRMLTGQVLVIAGVGYGIGVGAASLAGTLMAGGNGGGSGLAFKMSWHIPVVGAAAVLLCCLAAGGLSMLRVLKLEPAIVFKG